MTGCDRETCRSLSRWPGSFPGLLGCFALVFFSLAIFWAPPIEASVQESSDGLRARPGPWAHFPPRTFLPQRAEFTEDPNARTYRTAPADPSVQDLNEEERQKEEKAWIMLQNMDLYPRERHPRPHPPVNPPSHGPSVNRP